MTKTFLDNVTFPQARINLNAALNDLDVDYVGATEPATTQAYQSWLDTSASPPLLKRRNASDTAWELFVESAGLIDEDNMVSDSDQAFPTQQSVKAYADTLHSAKNVLINGGMTIDQRNDGAAQTITAGAAKAYTVDRWYAYCTGANVTGQQVTGSDQTQHRYQFTGAASNTAIQFGQRIEKRNSYHLNGQTATFSVDLANSLLTTVTWTAYYANTDDTFGTIASPTRTQIDTGTFTVSSTVTRYSTQISIPSAATTGLEIVLSVANQTSGTWTIGNAQLELGAISTDFEREDLSLSQAKCQYYARWNPSIIVWTTSTTTFNAGAPTFLGEMRVSPTATIVDTTGAIHDPGVGFGDLITIDWRNTYVDGTCSATTANKVHNLVVNKVWLSSEL